MTVVRNTATGTGYELRIVGHNAILEPLHDGYERLRYSVMGFKEALLSGFYYPDTKGGYPPVINKLEDHEP